MRLQTRFKTDHLRTSHGLCFTFFIGFSNGVLVPLRFPGSPVVEDGLVLFRFGTGGLGGGWLALLDRLEAAPAQIVTHF